MSEILNTSSGDEAVPNFVSPRNILQLTDFEIDNLLDGIRLRRMISLTIYQDTMEQKERAQLARVEARLEKKSEQFHRQLASCDKALEKLEMVTNEIRGLRLQMGLDPM